jgi:hypothetical protein
LNVGNGEGRIRGKRKTSERRMTESSPGDGRIEEKKENNGEKDDRYWARRWRNSRQEDDRGVSEMVEYLPG